MIQFFAIAKISGLTIFELDLPFYNRYTLQIIATHRDSPFHMEVRDQEGRDQFCMLVKGKGTFILWSPGSGKEGSPMDHPFHKVQDVGERDHPFLAVGGCGWRWVSVHLRLRLLE